MPSSPYIDGNGQLKNRQVRDDGVNHTPVISFEDNVISLNRLRTYRPVEEGTGTHTNDTGLITFTIDTRGYTYCTLGIKNTGNTNWNDFVLDLSPKHGSNNWYSAGYNQDTGFTTDSGESTNNPLKFIRKGSPLSPRKLFQNESTMVILFVAGIPHIRVRIFSGGATGKAQVDVCLSQN